jgi:excisionase family DNA binding protein
MLEYGILRARRTTVDDDPLLTVEEVARIVRVNPETVRRWLRDGLLRGVRPGSRRLGYRIRRSELQRFLSGEPRDQPRARAG